MVNFYQFIAYTITYLTTSIYKNGTSAPIEEPILIKSLEQIFKLYNFDNPFKTQAAFEDPPPKPLPGGMFFLRSMLTPAMSK